MPGGGGVSPGEIDAKIQGAVQQALQAAQGAGGGGMPGQAAKPPKPDINTVATDLFQLKKMIFADMRQRGVEPPPDILDGPNRDPVTGAPTASPTGGSDVPPEGGQPPQGAFPPIEPMQPGLPPGGGGKQASHLSHTAAVAGLLKEASDVLRLYAAIKSHEALGEDAWAAVPVVEKAAQDKAIYGSSNGPGEVYANPARRMAGKAAATLKVFRAKAAAAAR
jgi:hypothetical protein